jgi:hypothetical protein
MRGKKGAVELSISTIVIVVLAMSMLILGLLLIKGIFSGATYNVNKMNDKVKDEINKLFVEDKRVVLYLDNNGADVKQGQVYGIAWGLQNKIATQKFYWEVVVNDDGTRDKCGVTTLQTEKWISTGGSGSADVASGRNYYDLILFNIPADSVSDISRCIVRFQLVVKKEDKSVYETIPFNVVVK